MKRLLLAALASALVLVSLSGCGSAPAATVSAPTQTPWIVVITATDVAQVLPTQTPWIVVITATPVPAASVGPTQAAVMPTVEATQKATAKPTTKPTATASPGVTTTTVPGTTATQTPRLPAPTLTSRPTATPKYTAPVLSEPPSEVSISWDHNALLIWQPVGNLSADEYYCVHLDAYRESDGAPWYGDYVFTKDTFYDAGGSFLAPFRPPEAQGRATVYWWVSIVRKTGQDPTGKPVGVEISPPSDKRLFVAESKPE